LLSEISPEIVGEPVEANRFYDAVSCLMSYMVSVLNFFFMKNGELLEFSVLLVLLYTCTLGWARPITQTWPNTLYSHNCCN
jgi:hypothetical protein